MPAIAAWSIWLALLSLMASNCTRFSSLRKLQTAAATLLIALHTATLVMRCNQAAANHFPLCGIVDCALSLCFILFGCILLSAGADNKYVVRAADLATMGLCMFVMVLTTGTLISSLRFFRTAPQPCISAETLACLTLLSLAVLLRKTGRGFFSILRSPGIGGKISRRLTPIVLLVPFARETLRVRLLGVNRIAPSYVTALLASTVSILSLTLVLYCAWRIFAMEKEIHALSLLDPLTGLHNLRGFELLASQALLIAQRSGLGFSVLFLDLDGLKQTNDTFGHAAGSQVLVETGEILKKALRETDVLGHIGGDEFVAAGQFDAREISLVLNRIEKCRLQKNAEPNRLFPVRFSLGYAITQSGEQETLETLLARADKAMYAVKRRKKMAAAHSEREASVPAAVQIC